VISENAIREILCEVTRSDAPKSWAVDHVFLDDDLDSLDLANFALLLSERCDMTIGDDDLGKLESIQAVLKFGATPS
jgi:acyl carrier protein